MKQETFLRAEQVCAARRLLSWSQQDLAAKAGIPVTTVADFELGQCRPATSNALAIRKALEANGVMFTETGVSPAIHWTFMTERGMSHLTIAYSPDTNGPVIDLATIFGKIDSDKVSIATIQCATPRLKSKVSDYVDRYGSKSPHLFRLRKMFSDMPDGEFFLLLPAPLSSSADQYHYEKILNERNHPQEQPLDDSMEIFDVLLGKYDLCIPRTDKRIDIGNVRKADRICRFCDGRIETGARFDKEAHAIPASLGNRYLKLADECDGCNKYFGEEIEPTLVELLNIQRVFLGIESRGSLPTVKFSGGSMFSDSNGEGIRVIVSDKISEDPTGVLKTHLGSGKPIVRENFYRALCKIALSVIPDEELPRLAKTARWVRYGKADEMRLPKIAAAVVMLPPDPSAQITLYIRKVHHPRLPHVVCEFRLGCFMYVYVLPFSKFDESDLVGFFEEENFKETFRHYSYVPSWRHEDYSEKQAIEVVQTIRVRPPNTRGD